MHHFDKNGFAIYYREKLEIMPYGNTIVIKENGPFLNLIKLLYDNRITVT